MFIYSIPVAWLKLASSLCVIKTSSVVDIYIFEQREIVYTEKSRNFNKSETTLLPIFYVVYSFVASTFNFLYLFLVFFLYFCSSINIFSFFFFYPSCHLLRWSQEPREKPTHIALCYWRGGSSCIENRNTFL